MKITNFNRRHWGASAALLASSIFLASCGNKGTETAQGSGNGNSKSALVVGFSQIGGENSWRTANTKSIKDEAVARGIKLQFSDAQSKQENQIKAVRSFIAQGVDAIAFSPVVETGWEPVLREAKKAQIPVILTDRSVDVSDPSLFVTFIGSDFVEEGRRAARWLAKATGGKAQIAELQGTAGASPTIDRKKGFEEVLKQYPGMKIIKSQNADFARAKGKEVMESYLKSPQGSQITAIYTHNDDMAMGAIQAMEEAGKKPGSEIKVVSINGIKEAFQAIIDGKMNCTVETTPLLGPPLYDTIDEVLAGKTVPHRIIMKEGIFDKSNAAKLISSRKY
jgi:simple sugar transport system substrate-binding protein